MSLLRLYTRVLELLGKEARLGWILAAANLLLAGAQFAEPVLFGKIVDVMSGKPVTGLFATNSPWRLVDYRNMTEHIDPADYILEKADEPVAAG